MLHDEVLGREVSITRERELTLKIFFDLDGPILDVSKRYYKVFLDIVGGKTKLSKKTFWELKKNKASWQKIFKKAGLKIRKDDFLKFWLRCIEGKNYLTLDRIHPNVKRKLSSLSKKDSLYLISLRQSKKNLFWQVKKLGINKYFKKIIHCPYTSGKPWQEKAKLIRNNLRSKEQAVIIGDTEVDIRAAKISGIKSIGITSGIRTKELLIKEKPDFLIPNLRNISKLID